MGLADDTGVHCPVRLVHTVADRGRVALLDHLVAALVRHGERHRNQAAENDLKLGNLCDCIICFHCHCVNNLHVSACSVQDD